MCPQWLLLPKPCFIKRKMEWFLRREKSIAKLSKFHLKKKKKMKEKYKGKKVLSLESLLPLSQIITWRIQAKHLGASSTSAFGNH